MSLSSSPSVTPSISPSPSDDFPSPSQTFSNPGNVTSSASLYLYTFLATLVLLLSVSAAIVLRSLILRRRHAAMMAEAIRNGTYVAPTHTRSPRIDPSQKPPMYEAHLIVRQHDDHLQWDVMKPGLLSLSYLLPASHRTQPTASSTTQPHHERARGTLRVIWSHFSSDSEPPATEVEQPTPPLVPDASSGPLRVSMLIAMPSHDDDHNAEGGGGLPHIEIGVVEVRVAEHEKQASLSEESASRV